MFQGTFSGYLYICYSVVIFPGTFVHQWNIRLRDIGSFTWVSTKNDPI